MRTQFDRNLDRIRGNIRTLGEMANQATTRAVNALINRNFSEAREVKRDDHSTDALRYQVENECVILLATQQPVTRDLRELVAATFVAVELERCGDYAKGVAKAARRITRANTDMSTYNLAEMEILARDMVQRAVNAFINTDTKAAQVVIDDDNRMDRMYDDLLSSMMSDMTSNGAHIEGGAWLIHAGHCLERYADRATNIAERVLFVATGNITGDLNVHTLEQTRKI
jgi:phosphate transport system protein